MEPLITKKDKRRTAGFVPYRRTTDGYEFFLQKRSTAAKLHPGLFGLFGGGIEDGETSEGGFKREVMEELVYTPSHARYFCRYEIATAIIDVYIEEVCKDFETKVSVQEGEYGKFMSGSEIKNLEQISLLANMVFLQVNDFLLKK
jgi:8-oxo-dGTP pyrophosphatase MutT (NUDIX family)